MKGVARLVPRSSRGVPAGVGRQLLTDLRQRITRSQISFESSLQVRVAQNARGVVKSVVKSVARASFGRRCSGSRHHHVGLSSGRSDLLISSVRRRNCPGNRHTAQPSPIGRRGSRQSPGGNRGPKHSWVYLTATRTASSLSINHSPARTPAAKVATLNAPNR